MEFTNKRAAIYLQIADYAYDHILTGKWKAGEKIISIRELAIELQVSPNTVLRAYEYLQQKDVIVNRRGVGYFIDEKAPEKIREIRKKRFFENDLPEFVKKVKLLGIDFKMVVKRLNEVNPEK